MEETIESIMNEMDQELSMSNIGKDFEKIDIKGKEKVGSIENEDVNEDEDDELKPVDINFNLVKNILESYSSQQGLAGPASNILSSMGIKLPDPKTK